MSEQNFTKAEEWLDFAEEQEDNDNTQEAFEAVEKALALNPRLGAAWCLKASLLQDVDKPEDAFQTLNQAVQKLPHDAQCWYELAAFLSSHRSLGQAAHCFSRAYEIDPNYPRVKANFGIALLNVGQFEQASQLLKLSLDEAEDDIDKAHLLNRLGEAQMSSGSLDEAFKSFDQALSINDQDYSTMANMASLLCRQNQGQEALECLKPAFELAPKEGRLLVIKGIALDLLGKAEEADKAYAKAAVLSPDDPEVWFQTAQHLARNNKGELAIEAYDKAISLNPETPEFWFQKSLVLRNMDKLQEAVLCHRQALGLSGRLIVWGIFLVDENNEPVPGTHLAVETDIAVPQDDVAKQYLQSLVDKGHQADEKTHLIDGKYRIGMTKLPPEAVAQLRQKAEADGKITGEIKAPEPPKSEADDAK